MTLVFAERAKRDIAAIYDFIAARNPDGAQCVEDAIRSTCIGIATYPFASAATDEPRVRRLPVVRFAYTVFFRVDEAQGVVEIARVVRAGAVKSLRRVPD